MDINKVEVEIVQVTSWERAKKAALFTEGKKMATYPDEKWIRKMLLCQHSPIRLVEYDITIRNVPQWVTVHLVRHHIGVEKFVRSQREDRNTQVVNRDELPQGSPNSMILSVNAEALINISRKRICLKASQETRAVWGKVVEEMKKVDPIMASFMVRECVYRSRCPEFKCCGFVNTECYELEKIKYDEQIRKTV